MNATTTTTTTAAQRSRGIVLGLGFLAGAVSVLTFQQGALAVLNAAGMINADLYPMRPLPPFGVPQIASNAFFGGLWGSVFAAIAPRAPYGTRYWLAGIALGSIALPIVGWFVVAPLKGQPIASDWVPSRMALSVLVNGVWGAGVALIYRLVQRRPAPG